MANGCWRNSHIAAAAQTALVYHDDWLPGPRARDGRVALFRRHTFMLVRAVLSYTISTLVPHFMQNSASAGLS